MTKPVDYIDINEYDIAIPDALVAQEALPRGESRLLVCPKDGSERREIKAKDLLKEFRKGDCLVVNNTKVIPARLRGKRAGGGPWEVLLTKPVIETGVADVRWRAMVRPGKFFKPGREVELEGMNLIVEEVLEGGERVIRFEGQDFDSWLEKIGHMPLPPYIDREDRDDDKERYQTVFAKHKGAVAAPTASLHYSESMLLELEEMGVEKVELTLHVGLGTFKPVEHDNALEHPMHSERYDLSAESAAKINECRKNGGRVIALGTTVARVLETLAEENGNLEAASGETSIYLYPGYEFKGIDGLMTNFHWPRSTLILLVSAFYGKENTMSAYQEAVDKEMRFFSYGDGMLII